MPTTTGAAVAAHEGTAMGSHLAIEVHASTDRDARTAAEVTAATIQRLEQCWSRFLPDSEISRCNATRGLPVFVSAETRTLVRHGIAAWHRTGGACDPTVLDALIATGYDRSFEMLLDEPTVPAGPAVAPSQPSPGCAGIVVDDQLGAVTLPFGVGFDPGAIGKGLAADLATDAAMTAGAIAVAVSIGGDLRVAGTPADGDGWLVEIREPSVDPRGYGRVGLTEGAVATSTTRKRRWFDGQDRRHHVIDPSTGSTATTAAVLATVVAGDGWWAEALATQLLLVPPEEWAPAVGADAALIVDEAGRIHEFGSMRELRR